MRRTFGAVIAALFVISMPATAADKTDVVMFANGDRLTGEVKSLERGKLRFKTDATDTISIEWDDIVSLKSAQNIQVETEEGIRYLGQLSVGSSEGRIIVITGSGPIVLELQRVVLMAPIEEKGIERLDGDITAGYNFAKASEVEQFQLGLDMEVRTETRIVGLEIDANISDSKDNESSHRYTAALNYVRLLPNHWLRGARVQHERNDELGLDSRTSIGAGGGRILRETNSTTLQLTGGLQVSRENLAGDISTEDSVEAFGTLDWDWFRYDTPELDLSTTLQIFPNLSDTGRVRAEFDISLKWEIVEDLFWQVSFYDSYDSDPVVANAEENDYGINTSLGWDF